MDQLRSALSDLEHVFDEEDDGEILLEFKKMNEKYLDKIFDLQKEVFDMQALQDVNKLAAVQQQQH